MPPLDGPRASLCWTRKPRKTFDAAVVHADRDREVVLAQRPAEEVAGRLVQVEDVGNLVELGLRHLERIE